MTERDQIAERIRELTGWRSVGRVEILTDTSDPMRIYRGNVLRLGGRDFLVKGYMHEPRFGIDDQLKYWVFKAVELETGTEKIIKTVFNEEFYTKLGILRIRCYRSAEKEGKVLNVVQGDRRFMQGYAEFDDQNNNVRIIDFIRGESFFIYIPSIKKDHETYFHEDLPGILWKLLGSIKAIYFLHQHGLCHGDVRNDHIIIESKTGLYRWIDFDLKQDIPDFDMWSTSNLLSYAVAKGIITFKAVLNSDRFSDRIKESLVPDDGAVFYAYRIMNLGKLFPYIPVRMSKILLNFTRNPKNYFSDLAHFIEEYEEMLDAEFPRGRN